MALLFDTGIFSVEGLSGEILAGAKLYFYASGTSTPQATYSDPSLDPGLANTNPVVASADGRFGPIWLQPLDYKIILKPFDDSETLMTRDPINGALGGAALLVDADSFPNSETALAAITNKLQFIQSGTGAEYRSVQDKLRDFVSVKDFGAVGDGITDDSDALNAAIATGKPLVWPAGTYMANNLVQTADYQRFIATGDVIIKKNANGALFTSSGDHVELSGIKFYGDASSPTYTGHNIVSSGNHLRLINCGSRWAYARALLATGNHVQIIGTSDIYQTVDATSNGYDIEIGVSGTATLYHQLYSVYSSQATGGIKLIDTGSAVICGGQFGKLTIGAGTSPGGVNGGNTIGARILGNITVELSNAVFEGNTFSNVTLTFAAGTSGCRAGISNAYASGFTVVNNGNADNLYELSNGSGASAGITYSAGLYPLEHLSLRQNKAARARKADDSGWYNMLYGITGDATCVDSGAGGIYLISNGTTLWQAESTSFRPHTDNAYSLGSSGQRASVVYAATGTINTSDAREKHDIEDIPESWLRAWRKVKVRRFKWNEGDDRWHVGLIAQEVVEAFASEGIDALEIGLVQHDVFEGGDRFGIRYEQAAMLDRAISS